MYEVVERSMTSGGVSTIYSGYLTEEDAYRVATELDEENEDYWYEIREQRG